MVALVSQLTRIRLDIHVLVNQVLQDPIVKVRTHAKLNFRVLSCLVLYFIFILAPYYPCLNGGTATPTTSNSDGFTCSCAPQYIGNRCQNNSPCVKSICQNNATCMPLEDGNDSYLCSCKDGYFGDLCELSSNQLCVDQNPNMCIRLFAFCESGTYNNVLVKNYCPKTCNTCT